MWILRVVYIVELSIKTSVVVSYDHLVFTPIFSQMIKSFADVAYLVAFIVWVVEKKESQVPGLRQN